MAPTSAARNARSLPPALDSQVPSSLNIAAIKEVEVIFEFTVRNLLEPIEILKPHQEAKGSFPSDIIPFVSI